MLRSSHHPGETSRTSCCQLPKHRCKKPLLYESLTPRKGPPMHSYTHATAHGRHKRQPGAMSTPFLSFCLSGFIAPHAHMDQGLAKAGLLWCSSSRLYSPAGTAWQQCALASDPHRVEMTNEYKQPHRPPGAHWIQHAYTGKNETKNHTQKPPKDSK